MAVLYQQIKDDLLAKIHQGVYRKGEIIPPEVELAREYGVSRPTIRQALQVLADEGYLEKRRRRGTIVTEPKVNSDFTKGVHSFEDDIQRHGRIVRSLVITFKVDAASEEVALHLGIEVETPVYKLVRLRYVDEGPNVFVESYIPAALYPGLDMYDFNIMRMYKAMEETGKKVVRAHRRLDVITADVAVAALLDVEEGDPLFLFHTIGYDEDDTPVEYSVATYRGDSNSFEFDVHAD